MLSIAKEIEGKNYFTMIGTYPVLFTRDHKIFSVILGSSKHLNRPGLYKTMESSFKDTLLLTNGETWRHQRKLLNPALNYNNVMQNIKAFNTHSNELMKLLGEEVNNESIEIDRLLKSWAFQQSYDTTIESNLPIKDKRKFLNAINYLFIITINRMIKLNEFFNITYMFTKNFRLERKMVKIVFEHIRNIIKVKKRDFAEATNQVRSTLIHILTKQKEMDRNITYDFIIKHVDLMIVASFDTTATTIGFALYNLSIFPEIQKKAYNELFSILGNDINQFITYEHLKKMKYLDLIIKESMRIQTTVPIFFRQLEEDVENVEGSTLPKGLIVGMFAYVVHLDPELYLEPGSFIPERFLSENLNSNKYSYVPFAGGIRNSIGQKYAMLAMKIALAKILLNYELVDVYHKFRLACEVTLKSKIGVRVGLRKRNVN